MCSIRKETEIILKPPLLHLISGDPVTPTSHDPVTPITHDPVTPPHPVILSHPHMP